MEPYAHICWYCHWGWPDAVLHIYEEARAALAQEPDAWGYPDEDGMALDYGPGHAVWADENFARIHVETAIAWCADAADFQDITAEQMAIVKTSLERLAALSNDAREVAPEDYDGQHPEQFPPAPGIVMRKR